MDKNTRWVFLAFLGIGLLAAWVFGEGFKTLIYWTRSWASSQADTSYLWWNNILKYLRAFRDTPLLGEVFTLGNLLGVFTAGFMGWRFWKNEKVYDGSHEVVEELRKVTWPTGQDTQSSTIVVIITTIFFAAALWIFDFVWSWATLMIYGGQG